MDGGKTDSTPIWDKAGMLERMMGDEDMAMEIVTLFLEDAPSQILALRESLENGDIQKAQRRVHNLKASSANVGGECMYEAALNVEKSTKIGNANTALGLMTELETQFELLKEAMIKEASMKTKLRT